MSAPGAEVAQRPGTARVGTTTGVRLKSAAAATARLAAGRLHLVPLLGTLGANLWLLRQEAVPVQMFNDGANHLAMVQWAVAQLQQGHSPLDGWYPYLSLGSSNFHRYQSLPHILTALAGLVVGPVQAYFWSLYLLLALWPLSVYWGARLLGWDRWTAAAAAAVAPVLVSATCYGYENCTYVWWGLGAWTQLWGMWMLPITLGLTWRAVSGRGSLVLGAIALAACMALHFLTGYLAGLMVVAWVVIGGRRFAARVPRAAAVGVGALLIASWVVVPILGDSYISAGTSFSLGTFWTDSYGAPKVFGWLFSGQIFDSGRLPVVSLLGGAGLVVAAVRSWRDERARAPLALLLVSLTLFVGRPSLGWLLQWLPFSQSLLLHRFIFGVQMAGILLAGQFLAWAFATLARGLRDGPGHLARGSQFWAGAAWRRPAVALAALLALAAGLGLALTTWPGRVDAESQADVARNYQAKLESTQAPLLYALLATAAGFRDGRVFAGTAAGGQGESERLGYVPLYSVLPSQGVDSIGFTLRVQSMMGDPEAYFDPSSPAQYDLFNIRYLVLRDGTSPQVPAAKLAAQGGWTLWRVPTSGYVEVVDTIAPPALAPTPQAFDQQAASFLASTDLKALQYHPLAFYGRPAADPSVVPGGVVFGSPGKVLQQSATIEDGHFAATVRASRPAVALLKASYDPRWRATVDGTSAAVQLLSPGLVGVPVPAGTHTVTFAYDPIGYYPWLFLLALVAIAALALGPRLLAPRLAAVAAGLPRVAWLHRPGRRLAAAIALPRVRDEMLLGPAAIAVALADYWVQVAGRAPLRWDEAIRVQAGWQLSQLLRAGDLAGAWHWVNDQTYYPFVMPALHGLLLLLGADPLTSAWLPALLVLVAAVVLVFLLAGALGAGRGARWLAVLLFLLVPLESQLASAGLTEMPGIAIYLALLLLLARGSRTRSAVAAGLLVAVASWIKWDYGILAVATLGLAGAARAVFGPNRRAALRWHGAAVLAALAIGGSLFAVNAQGKIQGIQYFGPGVYQGARDPLYLLSEIWTQDGLSPLLAAVLLAGAAAGVALWRSRPAVRPALFFVLLSYVAYTVENNRGHPRYMAPTLAVLGVLAATGLGAAWQRLPASAASRRPLIWAATLLAVVALALPQLPVLTQRWWFNADDPAAADVNAFALGQLPPYGPLVYIGASDEVSTYALQVYYEAAHGLPAPAVDYLPETSPDSRYQYLLSFLGSIHPTLILGVGVPPGSRFDTADHRNVWPGQFEYFQDAQVLAARGCLHQVAVTATDGGRMGIVAWTVPPGVDVVACGSRAAGG